MNKTIKKAAVTVMMTAFAAAAALPLPAYAPFGVSVSAEEETVIELSSEEDINAYFRQGGSPKGGVTGTFKLMNDIELNNYFPIRDANNVVIDLNEHKISRRLSDATGDGCVFLVQEYSECTVELRNGTISGGKNIGSGGGIFVQTGEPVITLTDMTVTDNSCTGNGGGVYMGSGDLTVYGDTIISSNVAENNGGGIYTESSDSLALADGITIMGNTAGNNGGGVWSKSSLEVNGANITNNTAANAGGGIYIPYSSSATTLTLSSGNITANSAQNGGGVYSGMPINIDGAIAITDNIASKDGGGIYGTADAPISITGNVEISGNNAVNGGGLYSIGTINVQSNVTISGNKATDNGGGVFAGAGINASTDMYITDNYKTNTTRKSNVYLSQGIITLPSMPLGNTKVGVDMTAPGVFTSNLYYARSGNGKHKKTTYFYSDNPLYQVGLSTTNEITNYAELSLIPANAEEVEDVIEGYKKIKFVWSDEDTCKVYGTQDGETWDLLGDAVVSGNTASYGGYESTRPSYAPTSKSDATFKVKFVKDESGKGRLTLSAVCGTGCTGDSPETDTFIYEIGYKITLVDESGTTHGTVTKSKKGVYSFASSYDISMLISKENIDAGYGVKVEPYYTTMKYSDADKEDASLASDPNYINTYGVFYPSES